MVGGARIAVKELYIFRALGLNYLCGTPGATSPKLVTTVLVREMYALFLACDASRPLEINASVRPLVISAVWLLMFKIDMQQSWHT